MRRTAFASGFAIILLSGCQSDEIQTYSVPRAEAARREQRMLAAIVPHGDKTWYFKLVGSPDDVAAHQEEFRRFVESSRFSDSPDQPLTWARIPEKWRRGVKSDLRYATFQVDPAQPKPELTVTPLGRDSGSVLGNINRWRGQLGLAPITEGELRKTVEEVKVAGATAQFVDMTGMASPQNTMRAPPFAASGNLPGTTAKEERPKPLKYTKPDEWVESQAEMSVLSFRVSTGDQSAKVTVTPLPGQAGGPIQNINRWRGQIGLEPASEDAIRRDLHKIVVAGTSGAYVAIIGPESSGQKRLAILGVFFEHGSTTWFVKMIGNADLVANQKPNFESFVKSIQFAKSNGSE